MKKIKRKSKPKQISKPKEVHVSKDKMKEKDLTWVEYRTLRKQILGKR